MIVCQLNGMSDSKESLLSISYRGGLCRVPQQGGQADYLPGINPFPVTQAHFTPTVGASLSWSFADRLHLEFILDYALERELTLVDPGDDDKLVVDSLSHYLTHLTLKYDFSVLKLHSYIALGAGINFTNQFTSKWATTSKGYAVFLEGIPRDSGPLISFRGGLDFNLVGGMKFYFEGVFFYLPGDTVKTLFQLAGGIRLTIINKKQAK